MNVTNFKNTPSKERKQDATERDADVRKLRLDELYWLPVIEDAEAAAREQIQAIVDAQNN